jgi:hypothetical protein
MRTTWPYRAHPTQAQGAKLSGLRARRRGPPNRSPTPIRKPPCASAEPPARHTRPRPAADTGAGIGSASIVDEQVLPRDPRVQPLPDAHRHPVVDATAHALPNGLDEVGAGAAGGGSVDQSLAAALGRGPRTPAALKEPGWRRGSARLSGPRPPWHRPRPPGPTMLRRSGRTATARAPRRRAARQGRTVARSWGSCT